MANEQPGVAGDDASKDLAKPAWGVLLIWVGAVLLLHWGWGVGLLGAGVVLLGAQALRVRKGLKVDGVGLVAGALLVVCGAANLFQVTFDLVPALCILAGVALLASAWIHRGRRGGLEGRAAASGGR